MSTFRSFRTEAGVGVAVSSDSCLLRLARPSRCCVRNSCTVRSVDSFCWTFLSFSSITGAAAGPPGGKR